MSFENNRAEADATVVDASIVDEINPKTFDEAAIREHISLVHKAAEGAEGVLVLCVFGENPLTGRSEKFPPAEKFAIGEVDEMVAAVMRLERRSQANVYLGLHVMRRDLPAKARGGLKDLTAVLGLVADFDDGAGAEGIGNMRARGLAPSYIIESSPRNAQAFLIFDR